MICNLPLVGLVVHRKLMFWCGVCWTKKLKANVTIIYSSTELFGIKLKKVFDYIWCLLLAVMCCSQACFLDHLSSNDRHGCVSFEMNIPLPSWNWIQQLHLIWRVIFRILSRFLFAPSSCPPYPTKDDNGHPNSFWNQYEAQEQGKQQVQITILSPSNSQFVLPS